MAYYEKRHRSHRHRSSRPAEYRPREHSFSPFSFRSRTREPSYPTHYPDHDRQYRTNITTLPRDLKLSIFDHLDPVSSACLGLSSRLMYPSHRYLHKNISLYEQGDGRLPLAFALKDWAPDDLMLDPRSGKYVSIERYERREGGRKRDFWDGKLRRKERVTDLRRREERLRRKGKVGDLRGTYYGGWR